MTRAERLQPVVQHTDDREQRALREFAASQGLLDSERARLAQLEAYRLEYLQQRQGRTAVYTPVELQEFNRFLQQLERAIECQRDVIRQRERDLADKRRAWFATRADSKAIHKAVDRLQRQEDYAEERREQKALDEFSQRKSRDR